MNAAGWSGRSPNDRRRLSAILGNSADARSGSAMEPDTGMELENRIAMGPRFAAFDTEELGPPSGYTCPDCNGSLMASRRGISGARSVMPGPPTHCSPPEIMRSTVRCGWRCAACTRRRSSRDASPRIPGPAHGRPLPRIGGRGRTRDPVLDRRLTAAGHDSGPPVTNDQRSTVTVSAETVDAASVLTVTGLLDATTYLLLRDSSSRPRSMSPQR